MLTERAHRQGTPGAWQTLRKWFHALGHEPTGPASFSQPMERSPIVMVALGVKTSTPELDQKLLATVRRVTQVVAEAPCSVTVVRP